MERTYLYLSTYRKMGHENCQTIFSSCSSECIVERRRKWLQILKCQLVLHA